MTNEVPLGELAIISDSSKNSRVSNTYRFPNKDLALMCVPQTVRVDNCCFGMQTTRLFHSPQPNPNQIVTIDRFATGKQMLSTQGIQYQRRSNRAILGAEKGCVVDFFRGYSDSSQQDHRVQFQIQVLCLYARRRPPRQLTSSQQSLPEKLTWIEEYSATTRLGRRSMKRQHISYKLLISSRST
jgi:hypothetical protein